MVDTSGTTPTKNGSNTHLPQAKQERIVQPSPCQGKMFWSPILFFCFFFLQFFRAPLLERQVATLFWNLNSMIFQAIPGGFFQNKFQFEKGILRKRLEMTVLF